MNERSAPGDQVPCRDICRGLVTRVPLVADYDPNKFEYNPVPSSGKRLGNQVPVTNMVPPLLAGGKGPST
jgi:hypothetical protein